ncbi:MAG TPA: alpha/beta fold hydrolase, partial [Pirellulaceae bacterium]|nr:alpha/beta fold hydrolase [Pirellulaceae bacterium]
GIAGELTKAGFRVVFVDLRGHGASTGNTLTFGPHEARDLSQVIDEVAARGLLVGEFGVFGHSFGATTSIHLAAIDPRVKAVVATAPFADMRDEVPHYVRTVLPGLGHLLSTDSYNAIIDEAGRRGNFDPEEAQAEQAITHVTAPVLLLHGLDDLVVPPDNSVRIRAAAPEITTLELVPHTGHFGIWYDSDGRVAKRATQWFEQHLTVADASVADASSVGR